MKKKCSHDFIDKWDSRYHHHHQYHQPNITSLKYVFFSIKNIWTKIITFYNHLYNKEPEKMTTVKERLCSCWSQSCKLCRGADFLPYSNEYFSYSYPTTSTLTRYNYLGFITTRFIIALKFNFIKKISYRYILIPLQWFIQRGA